MQTVALPITERYRGPLILKEGLRPFFLLANAWAVLAMLVWIGILAGVLEGPDTFSAIDWHRHELLFGYTSAIIAGFLLTVVGNWTGRTPLGGNRLLCLVFIWLAGRVVMYASITMPPIGVAIVDLAFPVALIFVVSRELLLGRNYRNLKIAGVLVLYTGADVFFHMELIQGESPVSSTRLGVSAVLLLIMVIGGRIIPAFTRNWLLRTRAEQEQGYTGAAGSRRLPVAFDYYDIFAVAVSALVLFTWTFVGESAMLGWGMLFAALMHVGRQARWCGEKTFSDPLVLVLHQAYAFIPLGFFAFAASQLWTLAITSSMAVHLWTAGAIPVTAMAVMTRAGLGHTGQRLAAGPLIMLIYLSLLGAVLLRFAAGTSMYYMTLVQLSALLWCLAHALYLVRFARVFGTAR